MFRKSKENQPTGHNLREPKQQRGPLRETYMNLHRIVSKTRSPEEIGSMGSQDKVQEERGGRKRSGEDL